jgi:hypothetical protein
MTWYTGNKQSPLPLSPGRRRYGGKRAPIDPRDLGVARMHVAAPLPPKVDQSSFCGPVRDQLQLGACTAFAGTAMLEFLFRKWGPYSNPSAPPSAPVLAPLEMYYLERQLDGTLSQGDCGSDGRTACKVMNQFGVCTEAVDVYDPTNFAIAPTAAQLANGLGYRGGAYHAIGNVMDMKGCIASGYGFIVGFNVYDSFEGSALASSGLMPVPDQSSEQLLGGHEVFFCRL